MGIGCVEGNGAWPNRVGLEGAGVTRRPGIGQARGGGGTEEGR
jgi:hypothetical protein